MTCVDRLWVDAGLGQAERVQSLWELGETQSAEIIPVVGLESLRRTADLFEIGELRGSENLAFSLDLFGGLPMARIPSWDSREPMAIAETIASVIRGLNRWIVLDLASVGTSQGCTTLTVCRQIRSRWNAAELITGGGVRDAADLRLIGDSGCDGALVGSAIEQFVDGALDADELDP